MLRDVDSGWQKNYTTTMFRDEMKSHEKRERNTNLRGVRRDDQDGVDSLG